MCKTRLCLLFLASPIINILPPLHAFILDFSCLPAASAHTHAGTHVHRHACTNAHTHACKHITVHACTHIDILTHAHTCTHTLMHALCTHHTYQYMGVHTQHTNTCAQTHMHKYTHYNMCIHAHTCTHHTLIHGCACTRPHACTLTHKFMYMCVHITHMHAHIHKHAHALAHTCTHTPLLGACWEWAAALASCSGALQRGRRASVRVTSREGRGQEFRSDRGASPGPAAHGSPSSRPGRCPVSRQGRRPSSVSVSSGLAFAFEAMAALGKCEQLSW